MENKQQGVLSKTIERLLNECVVHIRGETNGTGFFVAPGYILTCAHVIKPEYEQKKSVPFEWNGRTYFALIEHYKFRENSYEPEFDLALLYTEDIKSHPCVYLKDGAKSRAQLYAYGYFDYLNTNAPFNFRMEGFIQALDGVMKISENQIRPGLSGAPLLNQNTKYVCGMINATLDRTKTIGGLALSTQKIFKALPHLEEMQRTFHDSNREWRIRAKGLLASYASRREVIAGMLIVGVSGAGLGSWLVANLLAHPWVVEYTKHKSPVWTVAWSPDGKLVASAEAGKDINNGITMRVWEGLTAQDVHIYRYITLPVLHVVWSPDQKYLAGGSEDGVSYIWDVNAGNMNPMRAFGKPVSNDFVICIAWSPDGTRIATGHFDQNVRLWNVKDSKQIAIYKGHKKTLRSLTWSPDSNYIASASDDRTVQVWHADTQTLHCLYRGHIDSIQSVAWSPSGKYITSGSTDYTVHVWSPSTPTGLLLHIYNGHKERVTAVDWSPDSQRIVSTSFDKEAHVWDASDGSHVYKYTGHTDNIRCVSWSARTNYIATAGDDMTVQVWQDKHP